MRHFSLNSKIASVISVLVVGNVAIAVMAFDKMHEINNALGDITNVAIPRMSDGVALRDIMRRLAVAERALISEDTKEQVTKTTKELTDLTDSFTKVWDQAFASATPEGRVKLTSVKEIFKKWKEVSQEIQTFVSQGHSSAAAQLANEKGRGQMQLVQQELSQLVNLNKSAMDEQTERTDLEYAKAKGVLTFTAVGIILMGIALAFFILRALSRSIGQVVDRLNANSGNVTLAAQQIAMSADELTKTSTKQKDELGKTSKQTREMNDMVQRNAESARQACELSLYSESAAKKGKLVVGEMINAISEINEANSRIMREINDSNDRITEIVRVISEIGDKTKVINDIVFQTRLLSFNASAEASRAGEHGKGFAVVAEEVRNLAQTSGQAARDITFMLDGSIQKVEDIVRDTRSKVEKLVGECNTKVTAGTEVARQCGEVLDEIVSNVTSANQKALDISNASDDQALGIERVFKTISELQESTQENAATAVETLKVSEELTEESMTLRHTVGILVRTVRGGRGPASGAERRSVANTTVSMGVSEFGTSDPEGLGPAGGPENLKVISLNRNETSNEQVTAISEPSLTNSRAVGE